MTEFEKENLFSFAIFDTAIFSCPGMSSMCTKIRNCFRLRLAKKVVPTTSAAASCVACDSSIARSLIARISSHLGNTCTHTLSRASKNAVRRSAGEIYIKRAARGALIIITAKVSETGGSNNKKNWPQRVRSLSHRPIKACYGDSFRIH